MSKALSFQEWSTRFLRQRALKDLTVRLDAVLPPGLADRDGGLESLQRETLAACFGAHRFNQGADWRADLRARSASFNRGQAAVRKAANVIVQLLDDHPEHAQLVVGQVMWELTNQRKYRFNLFPDFQEDLTRFFRDSIEALGNVLPGHTFLDSEHLVHNTRHGPFDFGRRTIGKKVRETRQLLAVHLEWLFRDHSAGVVSRSEQMPLKLGRPNRPLVATLVDATLGDVAESGGATAEWVQATVKSVVRDNPNLRLVGWPGGADRWIYKPSSAPSE